MSTIKKQDGIFRIQIILKFLDELLGLANFCLELREEHVKVNDYRRIQ